jgi:hypothetical protein
MNLSGLPRWLLPSQNPLGFGVSDFIALGLAILLAIGFLFRRVIEAAIRKLAARTLASMALVGALPVVLRLALLGSHPVPMPRVADDFSYLLLADTLTHFRLANPMHPMRRFFEGVFILQEPSYSSIFPVGQGLVLAIGQLLGHPWLGVLLSAAAFCALCSWMLRAWVSPGWALVGGSLAAIQFGPLSPWMNSYWGGAVSACAGCLVFGALPRRKPVLLGLGLSLQLLTRPYEFVLLLLVVPLFLARQRPLPGGRGSVKLMVTTAFVLLGALALTGLQNKAVTGYWGTLPYLQSRYEYGIPTTFAFQPNPVPHRALTSEQQVDYDSQTATHNGAPAFFTGLMERTRFFRFFLLAPLYFAAIAYLIGLRELRFALPLIAIAVFWIGDAFYPYFYPHYVAAAACLFILISVKGLERLSALTIRGFTVGREAARIILLLCLAHLLFWYGIHLSGNLNLMLATSRYESWDEINYGDPEGRLAINRQLTSTPGDQLVFVRFRPQHGSSEWIHNAANIDRARTVWALDLGPEEDAKLRSYYPNRKVWLLEADLYPPKLMDFP